MVLYKERISIDNADSDVGGEDIYKERAELVLVSSSNSYSKLDLISMCVSRFSFSSALYFLLTTSSIDYCPKERVNDFDLRRLFYSKQDLKNVYCSFM